MYPVTNPSHDAAAVMQAQLLFQHIGAAKAAINSFGGLAKLATATGKRQRAFVHALLAALQYPAHADDTHISKEIIQELMCAGASLVTGTYVRVPPPTATLPQRRPPGIQASTTTNFVVKH